MSTATDRDSTKITDELHALEAQEAALERRTRSLELAGPALEAQEAALERRTSSLELAGPLALILSICALALAFGALVVAFSRDSGTTTTPSAGGGATPSTKMGSRSSGATMMGVGGHGRFSSTQVDAAKKGTVYVQLGDYWAAPAVSSVRAGKVKFVATNTGLAPHELMVERMPIKFDSPMHPNEDAAQGMIEDMDAGRTGQMTVRLRPGTYMLFCNVTGHYAAGQHITFKVTKA